MEKPADTLPGCVCRHPTGIKKKHETGFENTPVCFSMPLDVAVGRFCVFPIFF